MKNEKWNSIVEFMRSNWRYAPVKLRCLIVILLLAQVGAIVGIRRVAHQVDLPSDRTFRFEAIQTSSKMGLCRGMYADVIMVNQKPWGEADGAVVVSRILLVDFARPDVVVRVTRAQARAIENAKGRGRIILSIRHPDDLTPVSKAAPLFR